MLLHMPWCPIDQRYSVGDIVILPFHREEPTPGINAQTHQIAARALSIHKTIRGAPVQSAALVRFSDKDVLADVDEAAVNTASELVDLACFSALAARHRHGPHNGYCNAHCFAFYVQRLSGDPNFVTLTSHRGHGELLSAQHINETVVSAPLNVADIREIALDAPLLSALVAARTTVDATRWNLWRNAVQCFNLANTDDELTPYEVDWILLCSAFQQLCGLRSPHLKPESRCRSTAKTVATMLTRRHAVSLAGARTRQRSDRAAYKWMEEFCDVRNDPAHGTMATSKVRCWNSTNHLFLARIAFPIAARSRLSETGRYQLTADDGAEMDCLDRFACDLQGLDHPPPGRNDWQERVRERRRELGREEGIKYLKSLSEGESGGGGPD